MIGVDFSLDAFDVVAKRGESLTLVMSVSPQQRQITSIFFLAGKVDPSKKDDTSAGQPAGREGDGPAEKDGAGAGNASGGQTGAPVSGLWPTKP